MEARRKTSTIAVGAATIVIHESLHALGLGENPPSSRDITNRVERRCWRERKDEEGRTNDANRRIQGALGPSFS
jgi:hypothetical protein